MTKEVIENHRQNKAETLRILEGKYIVFIYEEQDYGENGRAFVLFRFDQGKLNTIYHPRDYLELWQLDDEDNSHFFAILEKEEINEVYSVFPAGDKFFSVPKGWFSTQGEPELVEGEDEEEKDGSIECWVEYSSVYKESYEHDLLTETGIEVKFFDEHSGKLV